MSDLDVNEPTSTVATSSWDPFAEFDSWARRLGQRPFLARFPGLASAFEGVDFTPLADVEETDDGWTIEVDLAGIGKDDVEVEANGRTIVISGERKEKERDGVLRQRRRVTGTFRYEVTLGVDFDADAITAELSDGELTVTVPKSEGGQSRKIEIG